MRFPAPTNPATDHMSRKTCLDCPLHDGLSTPTQFQTDGVPLVGPLFPHGGPAAVDGVVGAVRIISLNGVPMGPLPHVLIEHLKGLPAGAHGNPPASVVLPRHVVRVGTPRKHRPPCLVLGRTRKPVGRITLLATARALSPRSEVFQQYLRCAPARAPNLNEPVLVPLLGKITKHHKIPKVISGGHHHTGLLAAATAGGEDAGGQESLQLPLVQRSGEVGRDLGAGVPVGHRRGRVPRFRRPNGTTPTGSLWSLPEMKYVAKGLSNHPGYFSSPESARRVADLWIERQR